MKNTICLSLILIFFAFAAKAQNTIQVKNSEVTISGTSTMHKWKSDVTQVDVSGKILYEGSQIQSIPSLQLKIPVSGIISEKGNKMDKKTYEALKSEEFPTITFSLVNIQSMQASNGKQAISAKGNLTVAGVTRLIDLKVEGILTDDGTLVLTGSKKLKMTDFEMDPPTALLGTIKTGDEVTVDFKVSLLLNGNM